MLKCTVGAYAEYFAIEFLTILCGFYGQVDVTSAWVAIMSIDWTIYILGGGYTTICRNYVGEALGQGNYLLAKKLSKFCLILSFATGLILSALLVIFDGQLAYCFTKVESSFETQKYFIFLYGLAAWSAFNTNILTNLMRMVDKVKEQTVIAVVNFLIIQPVIAILGLWVFNWGGASIMYSYVYSFYCSGLLWLFYLTYKVDWENIEELKTIEKDNGKE